MTSIESHRSGNSTNDRSSSGSLEGAAPDARIERAWTLPADVYRSPALFDRLRERTLATSWHWLELDGDTAAGELRPATLLPGSLDEPVLGLPGGRVVSNVCTHRGAVLVDGPRSNCRHVICPYHGRRFDLAGRFEFMPEFENAEGFPAESDHLPEVPSARLGPLTFASVAPASSFDQLLGGVAERVRALPLDEFVFDPARSRTYEFDANWALYVDNYLEGFHVPYVHPGLNEVIDYGSYTSELFDRANLQIAWAKDGEPAFEAEFTPEDCAGGGAGVAAYYAWLFPATMLNFYPWGLSLNAVQPLGPGRTRVVFRSYVWREALVGSGAGGALDEVELEDEAIVQAVQRGVRSRFYRRGRFSPTREKGVHHFHRLLAQSLDQQGEQQGD